MGRKRSLFVLGIMALLFAACAPVAAPTSAPVATPTPALAATPTSAPAATPTPAVVATAAPAKPRTLRMMVTSEPPPVKLSPLDGAGIGTSDSVVYNVLEPLVDLGKSGEPIPVLATKWEQRDPATWRFYLRKGGKFHNGDDFTTRDVVEVAKWSFGEKVISKLYVRIPIKEAIAVDDYTVDLIFEKPQPFLLNMIFQLRVVPTAISRDNRKQAETQPVGTGPYTFVEWKRGQHIKLAKFEDYWGPKPQIDDVVITFRAEEAVRLAALRVGEVDWVEGLGPELASSAPKTAHVPSAETVWLRFDEYIQQELGRESILADKRLRLAIEYAIDRQALVSLYRGFATPSLGQFASPGDFGFNPDLKARPYDQERARALVREAGAVGKTVSLVGSTDRFLKDKEVTEAIAFMLEQTGLKVKTMLMPDAETSKYKSVIGGNRQFMSDILIAISDTLFQVESRFLQFFVEGAKDSATADPEPTRLYKEVLAEADYAKREEKLGKAWAYVYEQAHYVPQFKLERIWGLAQNLEWDLDIAGRPFIADMRFTD